MICPVTKKACKLLTVIHWEECPNEKGCKSVIEDESKDEDYGDNIQFLPPNESC